MANFPIHKQSYTSSKSPEWASDAEVLRSIAAEKRFRTEAMWTSLATQDEQDLQDAIDNGEYYDARGRTKWFYVYCEAALDRTPKLDMVGKADLVYELVVKRFMQKRMIMGFLSVQEEMYEPGILRTECELTNSLKSCDMICVGDFCNECGPVDADFARANRRTEQFMWGLWNTQNIGFILRGDRSPSKIADGWSPVMSRMLLSDSSVRVKATKAPNPIKRTKV